MELQIMYDSLEICIFNLIHNLKFLGREKKENIHFAYAQRLLVGTPQIHLGTTSRFNGAISHPTLKAIITILD